MDSSPDTSAADVELEIDLDPPAEEPDDPPRPSKISGYEPL